MRFAYGIFRVDDAHCGWNRVLLVGQLALALGLVSIVTTASACEGRPARPSRGDALRRSSKASTQYRLRNNTEL
jgi:hypothetical protein